MKLHYQFSFLLIILLMACSEKVPTNQTEDTYIWQDHYTKKECYIEMRDGIKLFTTIYNPIDSTKKYPVLLKDRLIVAVLTGKIPCQRPLVTIKNWWNLDIFLSFKMCEDVT